MNFINVNKSTASREGNYVYVWSTGDEGLHNKLRANPKWSYSSADSSVEYALSALTIAKYSAMTSFLANFFLKSSR